MTGIGTAALAEKYIPRARSSTSGAGWKMSGFASSRLWGGSGLFGGIAARRPASSPPKKVKAHDLRIPARPPPNRRCRSGQGYRRKPRRLDQARAKGASNRHARPRRLCPQRFSLFGPTGIPITSKSNPNRRDSRRREFGLSAAQARRADYSELIQRILARGIKAGRAVLQESLVRFVGAGRRTRAKIEFRVFTASRRPALCKLLLGGILASEPNRTQKRNQCAAKPARGSAPHLWRRTRGKKEWGRGGATRRASRGAAANRRGGEMTPPTE